MKQIAENHSDLGTAILLILFAPVFILLGVAQVLSGECRDLC